jgi:hypothetical protein
VTPFLVGVYVWIAGVPVAGMLLLRALRTGPPLDLPFTRRRWEQTPLPDGAEGALAIAIAVFWPGVLTLVLFAAILFYALVRIIARAKKAGMTDDEIRKAWEKSGDRNG